MIDTEDEPPTSGSPLQRAIDALDALDDVNDLPALQRLLAESLKELGLAESAILADVVRARAGVSQPAIRALMKEAESYREGHGYLNSPKQVVKAYLKTFHEHYESVRWVGDSLYVYEASQSPTPDDRNLSDNGGFYQRIDIDELAKHLMDTFDGLPLLQSKSMRREVLMQLRLRCQDEDYFADAAPGVNLKDGFLYMDEAGNLDLVPHSPAFKARMRIEADYNPDASFEWLDTAMARVLPDVTSRNALQEIAGAILFNIVPAKDKVRRMFILHGARNSGKSTIINMLEALLPPAVVGSVPPEHWSNPNFRAGLEGLLLNTVTELGGTTRIVGEHMKKIVSCERIIIRRMRHDPVTITPIAWHLCATNELPRISDKTDAFERRLLVITFSRSLGMGEVDGDFLDRLRADPSAVLRWAGVGAARLQQNGRFTLPSGHLMATATMQHGDDLSLLFGHTQLRQNPASRVTTTDLRHAMRAFARERDIDPDTMHDGAIRKVADIMQSRYGATRHKTNGQPFYQGVELASRQEPETSDPDSVDLGDL